VKLEEASKACCPPRRRAKTARKSALKTKPLAPRSLEVKSRMPTRPLTGEGSTDREDIDKHLFDPPG
jgi:hypothetical protein